MVAAVVCWLALNFFEQLRVGDDWPERQNTGDEPQDGGLPRPFIVELSEPSQADVENPKHP